MIGRKENTLYKKVSNYASDKEVLRLERIRKKNILDGVSFSLKKNEILGLTGLIGSGAEEILKILFGIDTDYEGNIFLNGNVFVPKRSLESIFNGFGFIPADRRKDGLAIEANIVRNIAFPFLRKIKTKVFVDSNRLQGKVRELIKVLNIKVGSIDQSAKNLSGGNQQKIVIAKWLASQPGLLLMDNPTRGIDVGARSEIYSILDELAKNGMSIIITSTELEDILTICDRIIVFYKGEIVNIVNRDEIDKNKLLIYCTSGNTDKTMPSVMV
jgi:ABC-type sugar transport system ATPase subunit